MRFHPAVALIHRPTGLPIEATITTSPSIANTGAQRRHWLPHGQVVETSTYPLGLKNPSPAPAYSPPQVVSPRNSYRASTSEPPAEISDLRRPRHLKPKCALAHWAIVVGQIFLHVTRLIIILFRLHIVIYDLNGQSLSDAGQEHFGQ